MKDSISRQTIFAIIEHRYPDTDDTQYKVGYADAINDVLKDVSYIPSDTRLEQIINLMDGTIDHFDYDDAMDLLYQIKGVLENG